MAAGPHKPPGSTPAGASAGRRQPGADILLLGDTDILGMATALQDSRWRGALMTAKVGVATEQEAKLRAGLSRTPSVRRPLHPILGGESEIHSLVISDYRSKNAAVERISAWAASCRLSSRAVMAMEQGVDELLLNALYDAPHDEKGRPRYLSMSPQQRLGIKALPGEEAELRYASDASRVIVAVRDRFGGLRRATIIRYLMRCAAAQLDRRSPLEKKVGGSGVGLYLVAGAASELLFRLRRGRLTEVVYALYRERPRPLRALLIDDDAQA